jgi:hypothetical protein
LNIIQTEAAVEANGLNWLKEVFGENNVITE